MSLFSKRLFELLVLLISTILVFSCIIESVDDENVELSETIGETHISAIGVELIGKVCLEGNDGLYEYGFVYSTSAAEMVANPTVLKSQNIDSDSYFSVVVSDLTPSTTYYYRSYLYKDGLNYYGDTKSFKTKELSSLLATLDASDVEASSVRLNAMLDLTDVVYESLEYGFYFGESEINLNTKVKCEDIIVNTYSATITNLPHLTEYWYKTFVSLDSRTFYGEIKSFITEVIPVESISLDKTEYTFYTIGDTIELCATVLPTDATNKEVEWVSSDNNVVSVDANGVVKAISNGTATITSVTKDQGKTAICNVNVAQQVTSIVLNIESLSILVGETKTLTATVIPNNAAYQALDWSSSDVTIASVDMTGIVTALSSGSATITAKALDGSDVSASCSIQVSVPIPEIVDMGVSVKWRAWNVGASSPLEEGDIYAWGMIEKRDVPNPDIMSGVVEYNYTYDECPSVLPPEHDAATMVLGDNWRTPTAEEWIELLNNADEEYDSYWGTVLKSRINGGMLPLRCQSFWSPSPGSYGYSSLFWTSSLASDGAGALSVAAWLHVQVSGEGYYSYCVQNGVMRSIGLSIRPVYIQR